MAMVSAVLPALATHKDVGAVHLLISDLGASGEVNEEQRARGARNDIPRFVAIAEGWGDEQEFVGTLRQALSPQRLEGYGIVGSPSLDFYQHQVTISSP